MMPLRPNTTQQALSRTTQAMHDIRACQFAAYFVTEKINRGTVAFSWTPKSIPKDHLT